MIGKTISHYRIVEKLGSGGMGEVYLAEDTKLDRQVALKLLPSSLWHEGDAQKRLVREAKAASRLDHPNVVTIHGIDEFEGRPFIIMAYVRGTTLKEYCAGERRTTDELVDLAVQIADGLQHAHEAGVVHRDLKPSNVLVNEKGRARILDFGIASLKGAARLTQTGSTVGTIAYAPPELAQGKEATPASDVYSLGVVMYQMLSGRLPFEADHEAALLYSILNDAPKPLADSNPGVTAGLQRLVEKCLEKRPEDRFASCADLTAELRRHLSGNGSGATRPDHKKPSIAVLPFANMSADPENEFFSDGLTEELLNVLARNPKLKVTGRTSSFAFKGKQEDLRDIGQKLGVETLLEGSVRKAGNRVRITAQLVKASDGFHLWSDTFDRVVEDIFAVQDEIAQSVSSAMHVTLLGQPEQKRTESVGAFKLLLQANHVAMQNTQESLTKSIELYHQALELDPNNARAWAELGRSYGHMAGYGFMDHQQGYTCARDAALKAVDLDPQEPKAYESLAWIRFAYEFKWEEAGRHFRRAHELAPNDSRILIGLAEFEGSMGNLEEALRLACQAVELEPLSSWAYVAVGKYRWWSGQHREARASFEKALELSPDRVLGHAMVGITSMELGEYDRAIEEAKKEKTKGYRTMALSRIYQVAGRSEDSKAALEELISCGEEWAVQIALCHASRNELDEAFHWLNRASEIGDTGLVVIKVHHQFNALRADSRYLELLKRIGLTA